MKQKRPGRLAWICIGFLTVFIFVVCGCASSKIKGADSKPSAKKEDTGPKPLYYDFGDVLVPSELKIDKDSSFVFRTPGLSAGVLSLKGRVEINSLINFFNNNRVPANGNGHVFFANIVRFE